MVVAALRPFFVQFQPLRHEGTKNEYEILSHLRLTGKRLGFLINFNVPLIKNGISRIIL